MALFETWVEWLGVKEGGYVADPDDRGGATNFGISQKFMSAYMKREVTSAEIAAMTWEEAKAIYHSSFWSAVRADLLPAPLAWVTADAAVLHGQLAAIKFLQTAVGVKADGIIGPKTLAAMPDRRQPLKEAVHTFTLGRQAYIQAIINNDPTQGKFYNGWNNRIADSQEQALKYLPVEQNDKEISTYTGAKPEPEIAPAPPKIEEPVVNEPQQKSANEIVHDAMTKIKPEDLQVFLDTALATAAAFKGSKPAMASSTIQWSLVGATAAGLGLAFADTVLPNANILQEISVKGPMVIALIQSFMTMVGRFKADTKLH